MTTTREALLNRNGVRLGYVLVIDGYRYLLTTAADTSKATTAWAGTSWSQAISGLEVVGNFEQRFRPFSNELDVPTLSFAVADPTDQFGRDMFTSDPSISSRLSGTFRTGDSEIVVKNPGGFDPGGGVVYVGRKAYSYSAVTDTGLTVETAGVYSPFETSSGGHVPGHHTVPGSDTVGGYGQVNTPPHVNFETPTTWIGREVGLFLHLIEGDSWNTKAEALCVFAGEITALEEGRDGAVMLHCADIRKRIRDTTLMRDQWTAQLVAGYNFREGDFLDLRVLDTTTTGSVVGASSLRCVSGASGAGEFAPGLYTAEEVASLVEGWLNNDASVGAWTWSCQVASTGYGLRFRLAVDFGASKVGAFYLAASDRDMLDFLGWPDAQQSEERIDVSTRLQDGDAWTLVAPASPMVTMPFRTRWLVMRSIAPTLKLAHAAGTFRDLTDDLPDDAAWHVSAASYTDRWSFFSLNDELLILGRLSADETAIEHVAMSVAVSRVTEAESDVGLKGARADDGAVTVKQVAVLSGTLTDVLTRLVASIDGDGVNHPTYDTLPWGAAIPWELLGDGWTDSLANLEQSNTSDAVTVIVEKPTRLWDLIGPDLVLRGGFLRWKDGGLQVGVFQVPNAGSADWALDEDNKAGKPGENLRTSVAQADLLINNIKIEFNRHPLRGEYQDVWPLKDPGSIEAYGERAITVKARNSYKAIAGNGDAVEALAETMLARILPIFSEPQRTWRRTISHRQFLMAPGDTVSFQDNWVRDPTTGQHGTAARGGTALFVSWSLGIGGGSYNGMVDVLYGDEHRAFLMPPCAEHNPDSAVAANGWDDANNRLYVLTHQFTRAADDADALKFAAGDKVRVYEIDPADPDGVDSFSDTIVSRGSAGGEYYLALADGFGGSNPAFDSSKVYRVDYDTYANLGADQQATAYQCGDDGRVADLTDPMLWGEEYFAGFSFADIDEPPALHGAAQIGDGAPMSPALVQDQARVLNHLVHYRTAVRAPLLPQVIAEITADDAGVTWRRLWTFPLYIGGGRFLAGRERTLRLRAQFRSQVAATEVAVRVTSSGQPPIGDSDDDVTFRGPVQQVSWSTSDDAQWPVSDRAELRIVRDPRRPHLTYLTVEGSYRVGFLGLPDLLLLPLS